MTSGKHRESSPPLRARVPAELSRSFPHLRADPLGPEHRPRGLGCSWAEPIAPAARSTEDQDSGSPCGADGHGVRLRSPQCSRKRASKLSLMGQRPVAARFWTLILVALLLGVAPASRLGSLDFAPSRLGERPEVFGNHPFGDGMVLGSARLFVSESSGIEERSLPVSVTAGLVALCTLLAVGASWGSSLLGGRRPLLSPLERIAGPRAPPLQLA